MDSMLVRVIIVLLCIFVLFALVSHYNRRASVRKFPVGVEGFQTAPAAPAAMDVGAGSGSIKQQGSCGGNTVMPSEQDDNLQFRALDGSDDSGGQLPSDCFPRDKLSAQDLLPKDAADSTWAQVNPAGQGGVTDGNFLTAGAHMGIDTQGSSLRNGSFDIRGDPLPNPQVPVGPWMQSSIEPDNNIKSLC